MLPCMRSTNPEVVLEQSRTRGHDSVSKTYYRNHHPWPLSVRHVALEYSFRSYTLIRADTAKAYLSYC